MKRVRSPSRPITILFALLTATFSAALLGYLVYRERDLLLGHTWTIDWRPLLPATLLFGLALLVAALIWAGIMRALGSKLPVRRHIHYYCLTHLAKRLPGTVWYIVGRGYLYRQEGESARLVAVASGVELAVSVVSGVLVSLLCLAGSTLTWARGELWALLALLALSLGLMHPAILRRVLARLSMARVPWRYDRVVGWVISYALVWLAGGVILFGFANTVYSLAWVHLPYVIGIWSLIGVLSVTVFLLPSNLGFTEVGLSLLLGQVMPGPFAVIVALAARILLIGFDLVWAGLIMLAVRGRANAPAQASPDIDIDPARGPIHPQSSVQSAPDEAAYGPKRGD